MTHEDTVGEEWNFVCGTVAEGADIDSASVTNNLEQEPRLTNVRIQSSFNSLLSAFPAVHWQSPVVRLINFVVFLFVFHLMMKVLYEISAVFRVFDYIQQFKRPKLCHSLCLLTPFHA